ncbi:MAG: hypothetical protein EOO23_02490 [Comamonadaceae bacterium]|nr:MAG: hypothetical protein EOO23_02490 [Comamonadaceae bacterium]
MADYVLATPDGRQEVDLTYEGEPPHGDSYHRLCTRDRKLPGYVWGCAFAASPCSRYLAASWMADLYQRRTIVIDLTECAFVVLPAYLPDFTFAWPVLKGSSAVDPAYTFTGRETWISF